MDKGLNVFVGLYLYTLPGLSTTPVCHPMCLKSQNKRTETNGSLVEFFFWPQRFKENQVENVMQAENFSPRWLTRLVITSSFFLSVSYYSTVKWFLKMFQHCTSACVNVVKLTREPLQSVSLLNTNITSSYHTLAIKRATTGARQVPFRL